MATYTALYSFFVDTV